MDHRCGTRQIVPTLIMLYPRVSSPVRGWVRDVSISGMFVELDQPAADFPPQTLMEVELTVPGAAGLRRCRCLAMVARTTAEGLGLMFDRLKPPAVVRLLATRDAGNAGPAPGPGSRPGLQAVGVPTAVPEESSREGIGA